MSDILRLYASVTEHDRPAHEKLLQTFLSYGIKPVCHNDTIEIRYIGLPAKARELASLCMAVTIHSVHLGG